MAEASLSPDQIRAVLDIRQILAGLLGMPEERLGPASRLRADLDMNRFEIRELRLEILDLTGVWLPFDPAEDHLVLGIGLMLAEVRG